ncbi:MAG: M23 family metallopeptidase [Microscillaceae bacterium]|nr:M23 family metallopeptidase [Microscillaceae bacterium]
MISFFIGSLFLVFFQNIYAQGLEVTTQREGLKVRFYAQNLGFCPYQCQITILKPSLLDTNSIEPYYVIVPPQSPKVFLFEVKLKKADSEPLTYSKNIVMGDPNTVKHEDNFIYMLPFMHRQKFRLIQGYNGRFSHQRQYALDFKMPEGTPICAIREGTVIETRFDSEKGGKDASFADDANYIIIYHRDGTFAHYWHLKAGGVAVKPGQKVNAGDIIGYSGNTGWSSTPHLHLVVKKPAYLKMVSIPTLYLIKKNKKKYLRSWARYKAYHPR